MSKTIYSRNYSVINFANYPLNKWAPVIYTEDLLCMSIVAFSNNLTIEGISVNESDFFIASPGEKMQASGFGFEQKSKAKVGVAHTLNDAVSMAVEYANHVFGDRYYDQLFFLEQPPYQRRQIFSPRRSESEGISITEEYLIAEKIKRLGLGLNVHEIVKNNGHRLKD